jgi:formylglycine-generating enzyme required for sulfatase activity
MVDFVPKGAPPPMPTQPTISLKGIDEAIESFPRIKRENLKYKLITTIRTYYQSDSDIKKIKSIPPDDLIKILWDTGDDPAKIKEKKKNFSNLKSTINRDLRDMFNNGKNPEGIKIGRNNVLVMSDEMKDQIIKKFDLGIKSIEVRTPDADDEQKEEEDDILKDIPDPVDKELIKEKLKELIETVKTEKFIWEADELAQEIENLIQLLKTDTGQREPEKEERLEDIIESIDKELIDQKLKELLEKLQDEKLLIESDEVLEELEKIIKNIESDNECNVKEELFDTQILIPKGVYVIGNKDFRRDEQPEKRVELDAFYIDQYPVTNSQFMIFAKETGYKTSAERRESGEVCLGKYQRIEDPKTGLTTLRYNNGNTFKTVEGACWKYPFGPGSTIQEKMDHPVVQISLEDALAFAEWSGKRLVTEFEWEAAARGSDGRLFPWGTDWKTESCNHDESAISDTTPVNQYDELGNSPFEVYDMAGNIFEWTSTNYNDPFTRHAPNNYYVIKGGSWATQGILTAAKRLMKHAQSWSNTIGFRCAKDSEP